MHPNFIPWVVNTVVFSVLGILIVLGAFKAFDKLLPDVHFQNQLNNNNHAVGMVISALILGVSLIIAAVLHAG